VDASASLTLAIQVVSLLVVCIGALWAYTRYALERALLAPTQFTIEASSLRGGSGPVVLEVLVHLKNVGTASLIVRNIRLDIRYLTIDDPVANADDVGNPLFGRVLFARQLRRDLLERGQASLSASPAGSVPERPSSPKKNRSTSQERGFLIVPHDTFVQPGVDQIYTFVTSVEEKCRYVLAWASFEYAQSPRRLQRGVLWVSRRLGLIQYTLQHATAPHTVERVFRIDDS
jgi:hypothetical protein